MRKIEETRVKEREADGKRGRGKKERQRDTNEQRGEKERDLKEVKGKYM